MKMNDKANPIQLLKDLLKIEVGTREGLAVGLATIFLIWVGVVLLLKQAELAPVWQWLVGALILFETSYVALHLAKRYILVRDTRTLAVGLAIHSKTPEERALKAQVEEAFKKELIDRNLTSLVKVRNIPNDIRFDSNARAEKYITDKGLRVLLWGQSQRGTVSGGMTTTFLLNVSYQYTEIDPRQKGGIAKLINKGIAGRQLMVTDHDSLAGVSSVALSLHEVALFTLGVCMASSLDPKKAEYGLAVLATLESELKGLGSLDIMRKSMLQYVRDALYFENRKLSVYFNQNKHDHVKAKKYLTAAVGYKTAPGYMDYINFARLAWSTGEYEEAKRFVGYAKRMSKAKQKLHYLSQGFIDFYEGDYVAGLRNYKKVKAGESRGGNNMLENIRFILDEYEKIKKPSLKFAAGWLSVTYMDDVLGRSLIREFVREAQDDPACKVLIDEAQSIIND